MTCTGGSTSWTHTNYRSACYIHTHSRPKLYYGTACMMNKNSTGCIRECYSRQHSCVHPSVILRHHTHQSAILFAFTYTHTTASSTHTDTPTHPYNCIIHTHRHTHPPIYTLDIYYIQKEVWVCTASLPTNTIAKCNSPINTKTYHMCSNYLRTKLSWLEDFIKIHGFYFRRCRSSPSLYYIYTLYL